jgi:type I restriction enzyme, S subunit
VSLRLKHVANFRAGGTPSTEEPGYWSEDDGIPWVAIGDMSDGGLVTRTTKLLTMDGVRAHNLPIGDPGTILLAMYATVGATAVLGITATWNQAILGIEPRRSLTDGRFLRYWLEAVREEWTLSMRSNTQDNLNAEAVRNAPFPEVAMTAQVAIADHLDTETARIDALVDRYRRLIDLEGEKRIAMTSEGVEGRFLAAARRPSRLTYLQTIPEHWDEVGLTLLAQLGSGHTPSREHPEWWVDPSIPWITTGEVWQLRDDRVEYVSETRENVSELGIANSAAELHPADTVFLSRTASAGFSGIMTRDMATSQDFVTWTCGPRIRPRFLLLCLRAMRADLLGRLAMGSTHKTIYFPDIQSIKVPLPPIEEQDQVVEWVWTRLRGIDAVVDAIQRQVSLLRERRQAVITAAVTGQLEIPGVAA